MKTIDLNSDLGESFGVYRIGLDEQVLQHITSANIACGFHAGDPHVMRKTVGLAKENNVKIGAHPGFQDLAGFGRRNMAVSPADVYDLVMYQLGALNAFCHIHDVPLHHVKPHGALYNMAATEYSIADAISRAVKDYNPALFLYGLAGSRLIEAGENNGLRTVSEVFADRTYQTDGTLTPRSHKDAMIHDSKKAAEQVLQMVTAGTVRTLTGEEISIKADSICVHGDNVEALLFVKELRRICKEHAIIVEAIR